MNLLFRSLLILLAFSQSLPAVQFLKQSTAITVKLGPFVDDTDGKTPETSLTLSQADFRLSKNGGDMAQKNESSAGTHDELGVYDVALNTTDTGTLGRLRIDVLESGALPVWKEFIVLPANTYDSLVGGTDKLEVDNVQNGGTNGTYSGGRPEVNATHLGGSTTPVTNLGVVFSTDFAANYNTTLDRWNTNLSSFNGGDPEDSISALLNPVYAVLATKPNTGDFKSDEEQQADIEAIVEENVADLALQSTVEDIYGKVDTEIGAIQSNQTSMSTAIGSVNSLCTGLDTKLTVERMGYLDRIGTAIPPDSYSGPNGLVTKPDLEEIDGGGGGTPLTADVVSEKRTWFVGDEGNASDNIITLNTWSGSEKVTLAANFKSALNPGTLIESIESVTVTDEEDEEVEVSGEILQQNRNAVNFDLEAVSETKTLTAVVEVNTTDSQLLSLKGELRVKVP